MVTSRSCVTVAATSSSKLPKLRATVGSVAVSAAATSRSTVARRSGGALMVNRTVVPEVLSVPAAPPRRTSSAPSLHVSWRRRYRQPGRRSRQRGSSLPRPPSRTVSPINCRPGAYRRTKASLTMATGGLPHLVAVIEVAATHGEGSPSPRTSRVWWRHARAAAALGPPALADPRRRQSCRCSTRRPSSVAPPRQSPIARPGPPRQQRADARHARVGPRSTRRLSAGSTPRRAEVRVQSRAGVD